MNTFKTTSLAIGDTAVIVINDIKEGKFGPSYVGTVNGEESYIQPSGNLKFLADDLAAGKRQFGTAYTVTRVADRNGVSKATGKAYTATQFTLADANSAPKAAVVPTTNVADKLAAIRAKRAQSSQNS